MVRRVPIVRKISGSADMLLLLFAAAIFLTCYCAFGSLVSEKIWGSDGLLLLVSALVIQITLLAVCTRRFRSYSYPGRLALVLLWTSAIAALVGTFAIALPQQGHPSIAIVFFLFPMGVNRFLIPAIAVVLVASTVRADGKLFAATGLSCLVLSTFLFSDLRFFLPEALDSMFGTKSFSRTARRIDFRQPTSNEMEEDIALIRNVRGLSEKEMYDFETVVARAPQHLPVVLAEIHSRFAKLRDTGLKVRALFLLDHLMTYLVPDEKGWSDSVRLFCAVMQRNDGRVSDTAAQFLAKHLPMLAANAAYDDCIHNLGKYLVERELHPPQDLNPPSGTSFVYRTLNVVPEIERAADSLLRQDPLTRAGEDAAKRLKAFVPYLKARQANAIKEENNPATPHAKYCGAVAAKIEGGE